MYEKVKIIVLYFIKYNIKLNYEIYLPSKHEVSKFLTVP
jgi:hypothetical protein